MLVKEPEKGLWIIILGNKKKKEGSCYRKIANRSSRVAQW